MFLLGSTDHLVCDTAFGKCSTQNFWGYVWHGKISITSFHHLHIWFYCEQFISISSQTPYYSSTNNSYVLSLFSIEFPALVNGISAVFHMIHHCIVVGTLTFIFLRYVFDSFTCSSNHLYVLGDLYFHHTLGWTTLGWSAFIRCAVLLFQLVKQDGWLREEVIVCCKSDSIWSGKVSQLPFKVEITPQVLVILCFIGICLFLGDFCRCLAV